jgi:cyanophycinase-like exopeptidase
MAANPGLVVLFGAGESSASGQRIFDWLFRRLPVPVQVAILETPAGFELNSAQVAGRIGDFLQQRLRNYAPQVTIVPARKRGTPSSPENPEVASLLHKADAIFLGPGSPTYAVRQLRDSLTWHTLVASHRLGAALVLASAACIAASAHALPVYEIYKVGEELHWHRGLDLFGPYGLSLVFVPHWNNQDGGAELDTSRCYMGQARFESLLGMLPGDKTVVGIDEHTALVFDLCAGTCHVLGSDGVTVLRDGQVGRFASGETFPLQVLGEFQEVAAQEGLPPGLLAQVQKEHVAARTESSPVPPKRVIAMVEQRETLRTRRAWAAADELRERIAGLGWLVLDTPDGPQLVPDGE